MTRPYGGGCSVEGGSNLNVKVGQIYLTINSVLKIRTVYMQNGSQRHESF